METGPGPVPFTANAHIRNQNKASVALEGGLMPLGGVLQSQSPGPSIHVSQYQSTRGTHRPLRHRAFGASARGVIVGIEAGVRGPSPESDGVGAKSARASLNTSPTHQSASAGNIVWKRTPARVPAWAEWIRACLSGRYDRVGVSAAAEAAAVPGSGLSRTYPSRIGCCPSNARLPEPLTEWVADGALLAL
jgi:hypothetical protein